MNRIIRLMFNDGSPRGTVEVDRGAVEHVKIARGRGRISGQNYAFRGEGGGELSIAISGAHGCRRRCQTVVSIRDDKKPFSFFLRDVSRDWPIWIRELGVIVTEGDDARTHAEIESDLKMRALRTAIEGMESEPESSFESAALKTHFQSVPTWLGISRNMRIFELALPGNDGVPTAPVVAMRMAGSRHTPLDSGMKTEMGLPQDFNSQYCFVLGRGSGCRTQYTRRLEGGCLPILHACAADDGVDYNLSAFAVPAGKSFGAGAPRGTHFLVADSYGDGHMLTQAQQAACDALKKSDAETGEETALCLCVTAVNKRSVPAYAWFRLPLPIQKRILADYDPKTGFVALRPSGLVYASCRLDARPAPQEEIVLLLKPAERVAMEWLIFHRPLAPAVARRMNGLFPLERRRCECRKFWQMKLDASARIEVPEKRINEMVKAGLLHLDMVCYGKEPRGTLAPTIGVYSAIGSESAPIIQFLDSMGCNRTAERCLQYFLDKQHEDGFIQNVGGYMLETGAALWSMGEHFRYTRDLTWVRRVAPKILKSCDFILDWRKRNMRAELRGKGFGMLDGKCADPEDPYHAFMLNGYAYIGLARAAEMLSPIMKSQSDRLKHEADMFRNDIRAAFFEAMAKSPVVLLRNGTWAPSAPPWAEARGPVALYTDRERWYTHGTFMGRDTLIGPLWLIFQEVLAPKETAANWMMHYHADLMFLENVAFSQPYYCRHDWAHLKRGEVRSFLKLYYHAMAGLADRETYTFWEHFYHVSPHKTHEEGWFLMQTRWMLYMEDGQQLNLMPGIPRAWMDDGKVIRLKNVRSYFGPLSAEIKSNLSNNEIRARVECRSPHRPSSILIRLPHPDGKLAGAVEGGKYDPERETVMVERFTGRCEVIMRF